MEKVRLHIEFVLGVAVMVQSCMVGNIAAAPSLSNFTDQSALLAFRVAIKHDPHNALENWTTSADFCSWAGVSCSRARQRATVLRLPSFGLVGTISPLIGNLSFLRVLILHNNSFHGHIAPELGQLRRLETLILQMNYLEGEIPATIQHCRKLQILALSRNFFFGGVPEELGTLSELTLLYLGENHLTGVFEASFGNGHFLDEQSKIGNMF